MHSVQKALLCVLVAGIIVSVVLILLTIVRATRISLSKHNFALLFLFIAGFSHACSYIIIIHNIEDYAVCKVNDLTFVTFYLMRLAVMIIYYLRIAPMIGPKRLYPGWLHRVCIPAVLSSFIVPIVLRLSVGEDINWCSYTFFVIVIFTRTIPSFAFLALFFTPLFRFIDGELRKLIWKHGFFFAFDVAIEFCFLVTDSDWKSQLNTVQVCANWSVILQQVILVLMFQDAKYFYFPCLYNLGQEMKDEMDEHHYSLVDGLSRLTLNESLLKIRTERTLVYSSNYELIEDDQLSLSTAASDRCG